MMPERLSSIKAFRGSRPRVEFAHLLRGIAAGSVLLHHFFYMFWNRPRIIADLIVQPDLPHLVEKLPSFSITDFGISDFWGHFGVALFFLVSGFVIPFSVGSLSRAGFVIARVLRIWPTYMVGFTITVTCLAVNAACAGVAFPYRTWEVLSHYLIVPRWPTLTRPMDGILWTLEIELFFYFRIRAEKKFSGLDTLVARIRKDIYFAHRYFARVGAVLGGKWSLVNGQGGGK